MSRISSLRTRLLQFAVRLRQMTPTRHASRTAVAALLGLLVVDHSAVPAERELRNGKPLSPQEECATFRLPKGFHAELVACEPDVVDPVAMAFDEDGRLYVAEMRGYPNAGVATGNVSSGRIKRLEDRDGDGYFETSNVFADGLRFPTGIMPWRGGLLVANAPDLLYLEDTSGRGKADRRRVLYTGFNLANIQQLLNSLQWGLDNYVHACAGFNGGSIRSAEIPDGPTVDLRGRGIRFRPSVPGSLEPTSGGGQYGLAPDEFGRWFTATNNQHLRHIVLADPYLRRNPSLSVGAVAVDIPDHEAACRVFRLSPFEAWRVERTSRRANFPTAERVPGGYITSGCSPIVYAADAFPPVYRGNTFVCDPANNLIHRDVLAPDGATFTASRADEGCEFLASTDNWFRPVHLTLGPDGAVYVLDFYREVIETPLSLPGDIKKRLNLESRGRGRIWRIAADRPAGVARPKRPALTNATVTDLVALLADPNSWWRLSAQRLLVERQDRSAVSALEELARSSKLAPGRVHALRTLEGLGSLKDSHLVEALRDANAGVREQALQMTDGRLAASAALRSAVVALADDPSARVRFQLALTLGEADAPEFVAALAKIARHDVDDRWIRTAVLSSTRRSAATLLIALISDRKFTTAASAERLELIARLARLVGTEAGDPELARILGLLPAPGVAAEPWQRVLLDGLGRGLSSGARSSVLFWEQPSPALRDVVLRALPLFRQAAVTSADEKLAVPERLAAARLLAAGPFAPVKSVAPALLMPQTPSDLQLAAVRMLTPHSNAEVADLLLSSWSTYSPNVRREVTEALFARTDRLPRLLDALRSGKVLARQLEPTRIEQLRKHPDPKLRQQALTLLAANDTSDRQRIVASYRSALNLEANVEHGRLAFRKHCATCHRVENEGHNVGPDLRAAIQGKPGEYLLVAILDPSREVDPRFLNYVVTTKQGQTFTGLIASETSSSLTLRRGEGAEDTILRSRIETIDATAKSVMPEGLEMQLSRQDVADLIAYLQSVIK